MTNKRKIPTIKINHEKKTISYNNNWRLFKGYALTILIFPLMFLFISLFTLFVCTWEGMKGFGKKFISTIKYMEWWNANILIFKNIKAVLIYDKKRESNNE